MTRSTIAAAATALGLAIPLLVGAAGPASAAEGGSVRTPVRVQAGIGFLRDNRLLQAAAQQKIDYSALGPNGLNVIAVQLPTGVLPVLGQVVSFTPPIRSTSPTGAEWQTRNPPTLVPRRSTDRSMSRRRGWPLASAKRDPRPAFSGFINVRRISSA